MATRMAPSTPITIGVQAFPSPSPTGNWRHPRSDEINKRLQESTFSERNVRQILWRSSSLVVLFVSHKVNRVLHWLLNVDIAKVIHTQYPSSLRPFINIVLPLLLILYVLLPLRPLLAKTDDLSDIPLTPQQRSLLGLKPNSQPVTPGSQYVTPPRYSRSGTPRSGSSAGSGSPFSGKGSPLGSGLGQSPSASPLFQKAMGRDGSRSLSHGSLSPLGFDKAGNGSSTSLGSQIAGSPSTSKGASVGLNNRWLYERGRRSSSGLRSIYS